MTNTKKPYLERNALQRSTANIRKTTLLFEKKEYSMVIVRSVTAFDVYIDGILCEGLQDRIKNRKVINLILKRIPSQDKLDILMKEAYGFAIRDFCPKELERLRKVRQERNDVVHKGTFSRKASAEDAMDTVIDLIRKIRVRIKKLKKV